MNKIVKLLIYILIPLLGGFLIGIISNTDNYSLFVPPVIFPIVWTILYVLMGISSYLIKRDGGNLVLYYTQLIVNFLWPIVYFNLNLKLLALMILSTLIILVINMINYFKKINEFASKIQIPYLIWLSFALFLNIISFLY